MELSSSLEAASRSAAQEFLNISLGPESLLSCAQELSTGPYPEPDQSSPYHRILFLSY
jgi:hypothetical protein